jgi:hypothetical protein
MKTGIIGLPQVGKTSLFRILTKAHLSDQAYANPREAHIGVGSTPGALVSCQSAGYASPEPVMVPLTRARLKPSRANPSVG